MTEDQIKKILAKLESHEARIGAIENIVQKKSTKVGHGIGEKKQSQRKGKGDDLSAPVQKLLQGGYFKEARVDLDVVFELQRKLMTRKTPLRASVVNVLRNMVREDVLERTEVTRDGKILIAYIKL